MSDKNNGNHQVTAIELSPEQGAKLMAVLAALKVKGGAAKAEEAPVKKESTGSGPEGFLSFLKAIGAVPSDDASDECQGCVGCSPEHIEVGASSESIAVVSIEVQHENAYKIANYLRKVALDAMKAIAEEEQGEVPFSVNISVSEEAEYSRK